MLWILLLLAPRSRGAYTDRCFIADRLNWEARCAPCYASALLTF